MGILPLQFDSIRSSYNAQKEQWTIEKMTPILAREKEDMKNGRSNSISLVTMLDFCYTSKSKLFKTLNEFTHGFGP